MRQQRLIIPLLAGAALWASCGEKRQETTAQAYPATSVKVEAVEVTEDYPASIRGRQDIEIYPQVSGKITQVAVTEGERVRRGQTLFILDQVPYEAALQTAMANVKAAEAGAATARQTFEGKKRLFDDRVISEFELNTARNALLTAEAQLAQAEAQELNARNDLSYTREFGIS